MKKLVSAVHNNVPGIHEELNQISAAKAEAALALVPREFDPGGALNIGPTVNRYLQAFSLKLGSALHYEFSKHILPPDGAVSARWFSNHDPFTGAFPHWALEYLQPPKTLRQGKVVVSDQFEYSWRPCEDAPSLMLFASFRKAFCVLASTSLVKADMPPVSEEMNVVSPIELGELLRTI